MTTCRAGLKPLQCAHDSDAIVRCICQKMQRLGLNCVLLGSVNINTVSRCRLIKKHLQHITFS